MTRGKDKEASKKHYHPEHVLLTNDKRTQLCWRLHTAVVTWDCNGATSIKSPEWGKSHPQKIM
jgi:hypothetical protein